MTRPYVRGSISVRFWARVRKDERCWEWTGSTAHGYGNINVGNKKYDLAHRVSWKLSRGLIPAGLFVLHSCDNPLCVNPDHLEVAYNAPGVQSASTIGQFRAVADAAVRRYVEESRGDHASA
jgi:hypothetical protein